MMVSGLEGHEARLAGGGWQWTTLDDVSQGLPPQELLKLALSGPDCPRLGWLEHEKGKEILTG
jgi:hypothetical protein